MRFPMAAIGFLIGSFIFFCFAVPAYLIVYTASDALMPYSSGVGGGQFAYYLNMLPTALGLIAVIFFIVGVLLVFVAESLSDDSDYVYMEGR